MTGEIKKRFMAFILHFFKYSKLTRPDHSISFTTEVVFAACRQTHLNGIYVAAISHAAVSLSL